MKIANRGLAAFGFSLVTAAAIYSVAASADKHGCAPGPPPAAGTSKTAFAYYDALVARRDCMSAFSLRDNAQLEQYKHSKRATQLVTYDPVNDRDPRKQDAAKLVVPAGQVSLRSTVRLPIGTEDGTTTLVTWDAWFGSEFRYESTGITNYKTFQFASPAKKIWFEVRTKFKGAEEGRGKGNAARTDRPNRRASAGGKGSAGGEKESGRKRAQKDNAEKPEAASPASPVKSAHVDLGLVDARAYGAKGTALGPNVENGGSLTPKAGNFTVRSEVWTRYWVLIEQRANDWDLVSLWVADEDHDPVQIIDRRQLSVNGSVDAFWLEYNTSSHGGANLGERVGYVRDVVMLRNAKDVPALLQRPAR